MTSKVMLMAKKLSGSMPWFRAYALPMIEGSVTQTMSDTQQLIWWKLVALARISKFGDGTLRHGEGVPMTTKWIAARLGYAEQQIRETLEICIHDKNFEDGRYRVKLWPDGTIELCNFLEFNPRPRDRGNNQHPMTEEAKWGMATRQGIKDPERFHRIADNLDTPVRAYPKSTQGVKHDKGRARRPSGVSKPQEL